MSSPKKQDPVAPPQPDAPAAKTIMGSEDTPAQAVEKRKNSRRNLLATYLSEAAPSGVGVNV